jgi:glycosyltransferase
VHFLKWAFELQGNLFKLHALKSKTEDQRSAFEQLLYTTDEYESLLYKEVDCVIALSQNMKNFLCNEYQLNPDKIIVIPNGLKNGELTIDNGKFYFKEELLKKWRISENELLILFAGRLQPVKGLLFLIRAFHKVLQIIPDCRLIIAGSGNNDLYLKESRDINAKITFTGLLEKKALYELYQIADVGVVPSLYESFGYVAVEMMMHSLPVVATATSGLNEVVDDTCGLKIPLITHPDKVEIDTGLLAGKIIYLLQHPLVAKEMGRNGRKRYLQEFSSRIFRKNMLQLYRSMF